MISPFACCRITTSLPVTVGDATSGNGGAGGDVQTITVTVGRFAQILRAGAGGNGSALGGAGGSVKDSTIIGDIGNLAKGPNLLGSQFGIDATQMGGLFAGTGGTGTIAGSAGSILNITATRIAAILAVNSNTTASNLAATNAVTAITNVKASIYAADNVNSGVFDFTDNVGTVGFVLGDGDTVIDGLVLVKSGGLITALSPAPAAGFVILV